MAAVRTPKWKQPLGETNRWGTNKQTNNNFSWNNQHHGIITMLSCFACDFSKTKQAFLHKFHK